MKVVLTGASGLLGRALDSSWSADGHDVVRLVRRTPSSPDEARWAPEAGTVDRGAVRGAQVLLGAGQADLEMGGVGTGHGRARLRVGPTLRKAGGPMQPPRAR